MSNLQVLLLIAAFLTLTLGSFIWYIATWDASEREPVSIISPTNTPAGGQSFAETLNPISVPEIVLRQQQRALT